MTTNEWDQLNHRLDEQFGHLHDRLDGLQAALQNLDRAFREYTETHAAYHRDNEHHWGPERLAQRHPFRTAIVASLFTFLIFFGAPESAEFLARVMAWLMR